jgi:iron complex transport system substrate-binding protein
MNWLHTKRMKTALLLLGLIVMLALAAGCGPAPTATVVAPTATPQPTVAPKAAQPTTAPTSASATQTVTDPAGRSVTLPAPDKLQRVAVLTSPQVLVAYALGAQDKLAAVTNAVKRWPFLVKFDPRLANVPAVRAQFAQINMEALLQANPDVCIGSVGDMEVVEKNSKIPTLHVAANQPGRYFEYQRTEVAFIGAVLGKQERAQNYLNYLNRTLETLKARTADIPTDKRVKVYLGFNPDHLTTYGGDTYMQEWIEAAGLRNAAAEVSTIGGTEGGLAIIALEQILAWDPDMIVVDSGNLQTLAADARWQTMRAVKEGKVYFMPVGLFIWNRPSVEAAVMLPEWLALKAYPDRFKDMTVEQEIARFYDQVFGFKFSEADIKQVVAPGGN